MNTITSLFQQAQLAEAAYANFIDNAGSLITTDAGVTTALQTGGMSTAQATEFVLHWRVVDHIPNLFSGFSATIFESKDNPGQYTLAIRGSLDLMDFSADAALIVNDGIAVQQLVDLYNFWQRATTPNLSTYTAARLTTSLSLFPNPLQIAGITYGIEFVSSSQLLDIDMRFGTGAVSPLANSVSVAGHSLGGHLAMAFTRLFPSWGAQAVAVNGLGFKSGNSTVNNLFTALGGSSSFDAGSIQNMYGIAGLEFAAMDNLILQQPGGYDGVYIESGGLGTVGGHSATQMTDSLAMYSLFSKLDPTASISTITAILEASTNTAANSLEAALSAVGKLYGKNYLTVETTRNDFYVNLYNLQADLLFMQSGGLVQVQSLTNKSASDIIIQSQTDIAYRYALTALNPFAITGDTSLYAVHNTKGELELYDPATGTGNLTDLYLADRAAMLAWKIKFDTGQKDEDDLILLGDKSYSDDWDTTKIRDDWKFTDALRSITLTIDGTGDSVHKIAFGDALDNTLTGGDKFDHLYGGLGNDALFGGKDNDRLEGQLGEDILYGEEGNDYLIGGAGNDTLDGGKDADRLEGGLGNDTYLLKSTEAGNDIIKDIDGLGKILLDNTQLTGGDYLATGVWQRNNITYEFIPDGTGRGKLILLSGAGRVTVENFANTELGITLAPALVPPPPPPPDRTLVGDYAAKDFDLVTAGVQMQYDDLGNVILDLAQPEPNRIDTLYDSIGNDKITAYGGDDIIRAFRGGIDTLDGGLGNDLIEAGAGNDIVIGNTGQDILSGQADDDKLYAEGESTIDAALATSATQAASGLKGDWLDGGNDWLDGEAVNDVWFSVTASEILLRRAA